MSENIESFSNLLKQNTLPNIHAHILAVLHLRQLDCHDDNHVLYAVSSLPSTETDPEPVLDAFVFHCVLLNATCPRHTSDPNAKCPINIPLPILRAPIVG